METTLTGVAESTEFILLGATVAMFFAVWFIVKNTYVNKKKRAIAEDD